MFLDISCPSLYLFLFFAPERIEPNSETQPAAQSVFFIFYLNFKNGFLVSNCQSSELLSGGLRQHLFRIQFRISILRNSLQ